MTSYEEYHELIRTIDMAARQREIDGEVRAMESSARREAVTHLRSKAKSRLSHVRNEIEGLRNQRSFLRRRIRDEMRAQLLNLNADVEQLRRRVRETVQSLKSDTGDLAEARRREMAAFRAKLDEQIATRRRDTQRLLAEFGDLRANRSARKRAQLSEELNALRAATASVLSAHRNERARLSANWAAVKRRRSLRAAARLPVTVTDPALADGSVQQLLRTDAPQSSAEAPEALEKTPSPRSSQGLQHD